MNRLFSHWSRLLSRVIWWEVLIAVGVFTYLVWLYAALLEAATQ